MMNHCIFCDSKEIILNRQDRYYIDCPTCGKYCMPSQLFLELLNNNISPEDKNLFSGYIRNFSENADEFLEIKTMEEIPQKIAPYKNLTVSERVNNVLRYIGENSKFLSDRVKIEILQDYRKFFCPNSEELSLIIEHLKNRNLILGEQSDIYKKAYLTMDGWEKYERLKEINLNSKKVFVAMNFDAEFNNLYDSIERACDKSGFKASRVDKAEHNEKICDRIISEIKQSRFVIADFTGQKQGVYYEAGFAKGLGLPVIWMCKKDEVDAKKLHFDTQQYNHIAWETLEDLEKRLYNWIKATI